MSADAYPAIYDKFENLKLLVREQGLKLNLRSFESAEPAKAIWWYTADVIFQSEMRYCIWYPTSSINFKDRQVETATEFYVVLVDFLNSFLAQKIPNE